MYTPNSVHVFPFLCILSDTVISCLLDKSQPDKARRYLNVVLICISLVVISVIEHIFISISHWYDFTDMISYVISNSYPIFAHWN